MLIILRQSIPTGDIHRLGAVLRLQLPKDICDVVVDRGPGNVQGFGNFFSALTLGNPRQNILLAFCQYQLFSCLAGRFLSELSQHLVSERGS